MPNDFRFHLIIHLRYQKYVCFMSGPCDYLSFYLRVCWTKSTTAYLSMKFLISSQPQQTKHHWTKHIKLPAPRRPTTTTVRAEQHGYRFAAERWPISGLISGHVQELLFDAERRGRHWRRALLESAGGQGKRWVTIICDKRLSKPLCIPSNIIWVHTI